MTQDSTPSGRPIAQPSSQPRNLPANAIQRRRHGREASERQEQTQQPPWRSSLDLVWSYSRSQAFYAGNLGSSPSFTHSGWRGPSFESALEAGHHLDEGDSEEDGDSIDSSGDQEGEEDNSHLISDQEWQDGNHPPADDLLWSEASGDSAESKRIIATQSRRGRRSRSRSTGSRDRAGPQDRRIRRLVDGGGFADGRGRSRSRDTKDLGYAEIAGSRLQEGRPQGSLSQAAPHGVMPSEQTALLPSHRKTYDGTATARQQRRVSKSSTSGWASSNRKTSGISTLSGRGKKSSSQFAFPKGTSTFKQTLFNCINALVGVGILSLPLALSYASLSIGVPLFLAAGLLTSYTGKLLWKIMLLDSRLRTYADIGRYAFGDKAQILVACLFGAELWAVSVALIILFGDSMYALVHSHRSHTIVALVSPLTALDSWSPTAFKILGFLLVLPTVFMPLRLLAPVSVVGIMSTIAILIILITEGFLKDDSPGSLHDPAISIWPPERPQWSKLPLCFGLIMSGFAAHPVVPALVRDMKDPGKFPQMLSLSYIIATCIYLAMGIAGYLMFGKTVTDEVTRDLTRIQDYPQWLTKVAIWLIVVVPLTKFALASRPVMGIVEGVMGVEERVIIVNSTPPSQSGSGLETMQVTTQSTGPGSDLSVTPNQHVAQADSAVTVSEPRRRFLGRQGIRILLTILILLTSILLPEFEKLMALLGAALACTTCVIGPVAAHLKVFGGELSRKRIVADVVLLVGVGVLGVLGTIWAFTPMAKR
ncbi:unnamed protein product [Sympodiomycopsis kandeliae]